MRVLLDGVQIRYGHRTPERCETTIENAGGCVLALSTALTRCGIALNSSYLADLAPAPIAVSHMLTAPDRAPQIFQRLAEPAGVGLERACVLDHAAALQEHLAQLSGEPVQVTIADAALAQAATIWTTTRR